MVHWGGINACSSDPVSSLCSFITLTLLACHKHRIQPGALRYDSSGMLLRNSIGTGCICNKYLRYAIECNAIVEVGVGVYLYSLF
jgi:hypothetical protein